MDNINDVRVRVFMKDMLHPVRCKLYVEIFTRKQATAGELAQALSDIPQATLYRHLGSMVERGVLKVVAERKKRAFYERVYAPAFDFDAGASTLLQQNRGDVYAAMFFQYMAVFLQEFQEYATRPGIDIANDGSGFTMGPVCATNAELNEVMMQISALLEPLRNNTLEHGSGRRMHTVGLIVTPPKDIQQ